MITCKQRLIGYFLEHGIPFECVRHRTAFTAKDLAAVERIPRQQVAKVVMVWADGELVMLVLPANLQVDFERLREILRTQEVRLASEHEFSHLFPDCEAGAMPPFGNLYRIPVYVEDALEKDEQIVLNAGTHTETMRICFADYMRLVKPIVAGFGMPDRARLMYWSS